MASSSLHVSSVHPHLLSIVLQFLETNETAFSSQAKPKIFILHDYGTKYRLVLSKENNKSRLDLHVSVPGWEDIGGETIPELRSIYGTDAVLERRGHGKEIHEEYDLLIRAFSDKIPTSFASTMDFAEKISQIRVQILGGPINAALRQLMRQHPDEGEAGTMSTIPLHRSASTCKGSCYLLGTSEKVMVIFRVDFADETERALARLFQQFAQAQRKVSQSPHCEYRRGVDPPKEIPEQEKQNISGYLSFTFFPSHVQTVDRREKAVQLLVHFFTFLEKHVKTSKMFMSIRMQQKKDDLLNELGKKPRTECRPLFRKGAPPGSGVVRSLL